MMAVEYDDGDTEELIAPAVLSIEPGTPVKTKHPVPYSVLCF